MPLDDVERDGGSGEGRGREPIAMNCSGKHAAMLATCVVNGWDVTTYREPDHPLQRGIAETFAALTGEPIAAVAVDGCGAPLFSASLVGLARGLRGAWRPPPSGSGHRVAEAIRAHPAMVSGDPPRRADPARPRSPARSARRARSPATRWRWPTAGRSR